MHASHVFRIVAALGALSACSISRGGYSDCYDASARGAACGDAVEATERYDRPDGAAPDADATSTGSGPGEGGVAGRGQEEPGPPRAGRAGAAAQSEPDSAAGASAGRSGEAGETAPQAGVPAAGGGGAGAGGTAAAGAGGAGPAGAEPAPALEPPSGAVLRLAADGEIAIDAARAITRWSDASGNARDATPTEGVPSPRLQLDAMGKPYVFFDGTAELKLPAFPGLAAVSLFVVARPYNVTSCRSVLHLFNGPATFQLDDLEFGFHQEQWHYEVNGSTIPVAEPTNPLPPPLRVNDTILLTLTHAAATDALATTRQNGRVLQSKPVEAATKRDREHAFIGNNYYHLDADTPNCSRLFAELRELLVYDRLLSDEERVAAERYLAEKWPVTR